MERSLSAAIVCTSGGPGRRGGRQEGWSPAGGDRITCGGACWTSLPQPLFAEVVRHLLLLRPHGGDGATTTSATVGVGTADHADQSAFGRAVKVLLARSSGGAGGGGGGGSVAAVDLGSVARVCRDWLRLCREGLTTLRPGALPPQTQAPALQRQNTGNGPARLGALTHEGWQQEQQRQRQQQQEEEEEKGPVVAPCALRNCWMSFPHLNQLDLSAVLVAVQSPTELRRQKDELAGVGQLRQLRRLTLPLGLLAVTPTGRSPAPLALRTAGGASPNTAARGPRLPWPAWLQHLPYLREFIVLSSHCRTTAVPYKNGRPCDGDDGALLGLLYDGIRVADLPPLPSLASLELQLPGGAVAGGGLLRNLPSLTSLEVRSTDSRALTGMQLGAALSEAPGRCLRHLHLPCLSASPHQRFRVQMVAAGGGAAAGAASADGGGAAGGPPLEGLCALAAAAGFPLSPAPEPQPQRHPHPLDAAARLDPSSAVPLHLQPPPAAPSGLRTSLRSLSLSGRCLLADLVAAAAHLSAVTSLCMAGCDVRPRGLAEGLLTRYPGEGGRGVWETLYGSPAAVPPAAWRLRRLDLSGCRWLTSVPLFAANISRLLLALSPPGDLQHLSLAATGITRLPEALLLPPPPMTPTPLGEGPRDPGPSMRDWGSVPAAGYSGGAGFGIGGVLTVLDLSGNCFQALPESFAAACPRLATLRIDDNGSAPQPGSPDASAASAAHHMHTLRAMLSGGPMASAASAAQLGVSGPGGGGAGRGARLAALPAGLRELSCVSASAAGGTPLCPGAAWLTEHPATYLQRLHVSHCSMPSLVSMLPYLPALAELVAVHVPASVRGAGAIAGIVAAGPAIVPTAGGGAGGGNSHSDGGASLRPQHEAAAGVARCLADVTIRGDVPEASLLARGSKSSAVNDGGGSNTGSDGGGADASSGEGGSSTSVAVRRSSVGACNAALWWLERLCACAPRIRRLSYTRMGLTAVPDGIAAAAELVALDLSRNRVAAISSSVGCLSRLENLDLSRNELTAVPVHLVQLTRLACLDLYGNPELPPHAAAGLQRALPGLVRVRAHERPLDRRAPQSTARDEASTGEGLDGQAMESTEAEPGARSTALAAADGCGCGGCSGSSECAGGTVMCGRGGAGPLHQVRPAEGRCEPLKCGA